MDLTYPYMKQRCNFGRQPMFCEQGPELCDSIPANVAEHKNYILRNPVHQATQNTPIFSQNYINTIRVEHTTTGINHAEGGWPRDVNVVDPEATQRYRRKVEKDDNYIHCVMALAPGLEHYVMQNNAIDMYRTYYTEMGALPAVERNSCRTVNVYREPRAAHRPVSSICWEPEGGHRFAVSYVDVDFNLNPRSHIDSYVWDIENANFPETILSPPCALLDLQFNPREHSILAGGLINGQVGFFDRRLGGPPQGTCPPHVAHRELVRNVLFINSKSGQEFFSAGLDGCVKWWDIRNMSEPTDEMIMDVVKSSFDVQSMAQANGVSALEYEPTIPTRFMVGTVNGLVISGNRKGKTPMEKLPAKYEAAHTGPVWTVERNPGFMKNFLTVGDWTARVWSEDCRDSAIIMSPPLRYKVTHGTWSPTRLSLMLLTQWNGLVAVWDLLRRQHEPVLTMQVCEEPLLRVRVHDGGHMVACGSRKGNIYMVELSQMLTQSDKNDKALLTGIFERESKRERILEARLREIRLKLRQAEESSPAVSATDMEAAVGDRDLAEATQDYMQLVKKELAAL